MKNNKKFILASASPRRLQLLEQIGIVPDEVVSADIDESCGKHEEPRIYVLRMASSKARSVADKYSGDTILAADTIVVCGRRILAKTDDEKTAVKYLQMLSGRRHRVYTAICVINGGKEYTDMVVSRVKMARLHDKDIDNYIKTGQWHGKAGGYAIQGCAGAFVEWINGSYSNIVGLPLYQAARLIKRSGWSLT